jgi:hypothetical protein
MTGIVIATIRDNRVFECWNSFDFLALYSQLGVMHRVEAPGQAPDG